MPAPAAAVATDPQASSSPSQRIVVVGTTPLPGLGTPLRDVPANVQIHGGAALGTQRQANLAAFLETNPTSVTANAAQGNAYQTDIAFRGFTASPLLGVPQGLSVFQDGVRVNEPFGDVVNWDLLAPAAIASLQLIPGSNPLFGLNTLGGALAIQTKTGRDHPGSAVELSGGSFGRRGVALEHGARAGPWDGFVAANVARERGWTQHNPSRIRQLFVQGGWHAGRSGVDATLTAADNRLEGSQTLPLSFLDTPREAYTYPDVNRNRLAMLALRGTHELADGVVLGGNAYLRRFRNGNASSNVNDGYGQVDPETGAVDAVQATNDRAALTQTGWGAGAQLTVARPLAGRRNRLVIGVGIDAGRAGYVQEVEPARFDASRAAIATGAFETDTDASTRTRNASLFVTDTLALDARWSLTLSGRHDRARIRIRDRGGADPALDGDHAYARFNPAAGLTFTPGPRLTVYGGYSEGMRTPTAMELTCADPAAPCKLPNAFLADPPLALVVARTLEIGARGRDGATSWSMAVYRSELDHDLQFVSSGGGLNAGYFRNVGRTQRLGVELTGAQAIGPLRLSARYAFVNATYRTPFVVHSPANSSADADGDITVPRGSRMPGIPRHSLRLRADYDPDAALTIGATVVANGPVALRGDENGQDVHGRIGGHALVHLDATWRFAPGWEAFGRVDNVFDRRWANFGLLGRNAFADPQRRFDPSHPRIEPFIGQGAPRGIRVGIRREWS